MKTAEAKKVEMEAKTKQKNLEECLVRFLKAGSEHEDEAIRTKFV